jgi:hypothetical protein
MIISLILFSPLADSVSSVARTHSQSGLKISPINKKIKCNLAHRHLLVNQHLSKKYFQNPV